MKQLARHQSCLAINSTNRTRRRCEKVSRSLENSPLDSLTEGPVCHLLSSANTSGEIVLARISLA